MSTATCACDGSGAIPYVEEHIGPDIPIGNGLVIGPGTTYGTRLCSCRTELEPRDGEARWWDTTGVFSDEWESSVHQHAAAVSVRAERPISAENYILRRFGNRYYPTFVDIDLSGDWLHFVFPDEARALAAILVAAADAADAIDKPDCAPCGHWAPCDCPPEETGQ